MVESASSAAILEPRLYLDRTVDPATQFELSVRVDGESRRILVNVVDRTTGESVRAIPSEDQRRLTTRLRTLHGLLLDTVV